MKCFFFLFFFWCGAECHPTPTPTSTRHCHLPPIPSINHPVRPATHTTHNSNGTHHQKKKWNKQINTVTDHCQATGGGRTNEKTFRNLTGAPRASFARHSLKTLLPFVGKCCFGSYGERPLRCQAGVSSFAKFTPPPSPSFLEVAHSHGEIIHEHFCLWIQSTIGHLRECVWCVCARLCVCVDRICFLLESHTVPPGPGVCIALAVETFDWKVDPFSLRMSTRAVSMG